MYSELSVVDGLTLASSFMDWLNTGYLILLVVIGFSVIIFVHELGHFLAAKWMGVRVNRFAIGFFYRLVGYRRGEGFTFGPRPTYTAGEIEEKGYGETDYCLNAFPLGGYVKMLGQDDIDINEETGEIKTTDDPRSFTNKSVGRRMVIVSAGVVFNLLFAVLVYAFVFLALGKEMAAPVIGYVVPGSPAADAGLLLGDRVLAIDGNRVRSFRDIVMASGLSGMTMRLQIERGGKTLEQEFLVELEMRDGEKELLGIMAVSTPVIAETGVETADQQEFKPGDRITHVNGQPVTTAFEIMEAFQKSQGAGVELTVERTDPAQEEAHQTLTVARRPRLQFEPARIEGPSSEIIDSRHLLGFRRRQRVEVVNPGTPAAEAGFEVGDVIAKWGNVINPRYSEVLDSIKANDGRPVPVVVERGEEEVGLSVTPRSPFRLFGSAPPRVEIIFGSEELRPIVADIAPDTPASMLQNMSRGSEIIAINEEPLESWSDVFEALRKAAGTTVAVRYRHGSDEGVGNLAVPNSIVNELGLPPPLTILGFPPTATLLSINDIESVTLESGKKASLLWSFAVRKLLEQNVGKTVTVEYLPSILAQTTRTEQFSVRSDNADPWQLRVRYNYELPHLANLKETVDANGNPLAALSMGINESHRILWSVYRVIKGMVEHFFTKERGISPKHIAGPVGILQFAYRQAEAGVADLLFFLAFISINLAVLNFLPFPLVDGGLMMFLILEKIRRKPLSLKVQVITTLTGLGLIVLVFLFVTIQDISRLFGG